MSHFSFLYCWSYFTFVSRRDSEWQPEKIIVAKGNQALHRGREGRDSIVQRDIFSTKIKKNDILSYLSDVSSYWINLQNEKMLLCCWYSHFFKHNIFEKIFTLFPFVITLTPQKNKQKAASRGLSRLHKPSNCRKGIWMIFPLVGWLEFVELTVYVGLPVARGSPWTSHPWRVTNALGNKHRHKSHMERHHIMAMVWQILYSESVQWERLASSSWPVLADQIGARPSFFPGIVSAVVKSWIRAGRWDDRGAVTLRHSSCKGLAAGLSEGNWSQVELARLTVISTCWPWRKD